VLTAIAIVLAIFLLPFPWGVTAVGLAAALDFGETLVFWHWSRRRRAGVGVETLVGRTAIAMSSLALEGQVKLDGELWEARSATEVVSGEEVVVRSVEGLTLVVEPTR
jgi:membrane-bound serine protease (ClpP class)